MKSEAVGVCLGASTASFVKIVRNGNKIEIAKTMSIAHYGDPKGIFLENLKVFNPDKLPTVATGRKFRKIVNISSISEPEATEIAFSYLNVNNEKYSSIASLGGETFMVYNLDDEGKISDVITKNQCASGTGEFFLQQIKRMGLNIDEAVDISNNAEPFKVSGRCSVFCKSDCTHALNKGTPKAEVTSGLAQMIADKADELLKKSRNGKLMLIGGVTLNHSVMNFIKSNYTNIEIPPEACYFEALGAALYALENDVKPFDNFENIINSRHSSFSFHEPLEKFYKNVSFKKIEKEKAKSGEKCILGLDVGSTTTKAVILRTNDNAILASVYLYTNGNPIRAAKECYLELIKQVHDNIVINGMGVTGSGRHIAGLHALTDGIINEIVAHATAAVYFDSDVDTIFEIGGQDAKYTYIINKVPADYAMNEACSAGTGSFIEESAYESLGVKVTEIEKIALNAQKPPNFSDQCAAFISSDIKTALQENISREDVIAGLVYSICLNYVNRVKGNRPVGKKIFMQGGVCYNKAIPAAMAALTGMEIIVPPEPGLMGAFGVALEVKEKIELGIYEEKIFNLKELSEREVSYKKPFLCPGGKEKCDRKCPVNLIEVLGKTYPFGGACNKYYNVVNKRKIDTEKYDFVKIRQNLTFSKYVPDYKINEDAKVIGINQSFHTHSIYPLYYNFFSSLGFKVILSENIEEEGLEREMTSFCFPAQLSLGLFQDLLNKNPDFIFVPSILEMYVEDAPYHRKDFNCTCAFVSAEPMFLKQAFKGHELNGRFIQTDLDFANGWFSQEQKFIQIGKKIGIEDIEKIKESYRLAAGIQLKYQEELFLMGERFLNELEKNPDEIAIVLLGRPYNSFTDLSNKGIPQKFASRGVYVVPFDMFDYRCESIDDDQFWEGGKKILKAAKIIQRHPQLFATYITNFSCAPDSMLLTTFRSIMGMKPSLTLELDGHTADAGVNTRIEAALDIIQNYRKIKGKLNYIKNGEFNPAQIIAKDDLFYFKTSGGESVPLNDKRVVVLVPSMGDISSELFASVLKNLGYNAIALPEGNNTILKYGRSNSSGKECLPLLLCAGSLIDFIENRHDGSQYIAFFLVQGAGNCRLGQYPVFMRELIRRKKLKNVAIMTLMNEDGFAGLGPKFALKATQALMTAGVMDDIRSGIMANALEPDKGLKVFNLELAKIKDVFINEPDNIYHALKKFAFIIKNKIPAMIPVKESKYIALVGEIYVRHDRFSHKWLNEYFAKKGFILKVSYILEWVQYVDYLISIDLLEPVKSIKHKIERKLRSFYFRSIEKKVKSILAHSGYYENQKLEIEPILNHSKHIIPLEYKGEPGITLGIALHETLEKYSGVINLGPFGCMPTRFAESVSLPEMKVENKVIAKKINNPNYKLPEVFNGNMTIPFLTIETDGNVYPQVIEARLETFTIQAERASKLMKQAKAKKINK